MRRRLAASAVALAAALGACTERVPDTSIEVVEPATFETRGGVGQLAVLRADPGAAVELLDDTGVVATAAIDEAGTALFRDLEAGAYVARAGGASSPTTEVTGDGAPDPSLYEDQVVEDGFGYVRTRDGTTLSVMVRLPGPAPDGPYPTVVEYSGYDPSNPAEPEPGTLLAGAMGYATVGVNIRGTGCSGGAFDYFERLQALDGYDVVEAVARQPWVLGGRVGMVGISYPGISQLMVAATRPPSLAAITPLSVVGDGYRGTLYPGGIRNVGFAERWGAERATEASAGGQAWARERIEGGDEVCEANQALRGQNVDLAEAMRTTPFRDPSVVDARSPADVVGRVDVPTFLAGAWQDEQTGGHFATMLDDFAPGVLEEVWLTNGTHVDSVGPAILARWGAFLERTVARRPAVVPEGLASLAPAVYSTAFGVEGLSLPADDAEVGEGPVHVLLENGAGGSAGAPVATGRLDLAAWPPPGVEARRWYLLPGGGLGDDEPGAAGGSTSFVSDPAEASRTSLPGDEVDAAWQALPPYSWTAPSSSAGFVSAPLAADVVMAGSGSVDLWLDSTADDTDLEVVLSEVRPDGQEVYVQSGWLRASHRALDPAASTELRPVQTHVEADASPLPAGLTEVRVELFPFAHPFRAGSRIRVAVEPPGGDRPRWTFDVLDEAGRVTNAIAHDAAHPSSIALPVLPDTPVPPTPLPPCPSLRGQPCRPFPA